MSQYKLDVGCERLHLNRRQHPVANQAPNMMLIEVRRPGSIRGESRTSYCSGMEAFVTYKLLTYRDASGPRSGIVLGDNVHDVSRLLQKPTYVSVRDILDDWEAAASLLDEVAAESHPDGFSLSDLELLPPVLYPGAIYCAGPTTAITLITWPGGSTSRLNLIPMS